MLFLIAGLQLSAQQCADRHLFEKDFIELQDSLKEVLSFNKTIAPEFELQTLIALSYYPELADTKIKFVTKHIGTTMAARPSPVFLFISRKQRGYRIFINNDTTLSGVLLQETPFNAQVGVIGHELAHIVDYSEKNNFQIIAFGFRYLFDDDFKSELEKSVDLITIEHGLGWQVYDFAHFVMVDSDAPKWYKEFKRRIYYGPDDILQKIEEYSHIYEVE